MNRWILALGVLCACTSRPPAPGLAGPDEAVRGFAEALQKGDGETAWSLLSKRTRADADAIAAGVRQATDAGASTGRQMLLANAIPSGSISAHLLREHGDEAEVEARTDAGPAQTLHVVREDGAWKVELPLGR